MGNKIFSTVSSDEPNTLQEFKISLLKGELCRFKSIKVPTINDTISGEALADWILEVSSPKEIEEIIIMIKCVQRRGSGMKTILQTIAAALLK
ncbi:hypothetical protein [Cytobacillus dafuensis]|uniref:Uncharacterized protein n=1 Tax=Cytobacillus dafuensis TaxID=1742359 RepID=A0A5B8Z9L4_CYTDA|nr:hypothetical protein [Cytobacillus dafuensis]QED49614.1 hypothetical protein FSZ17_21395 [Cytobacillus dafuensis]